jgi:hypothetical protein
MEMYERNGEENVRGLVHQAQIALLHMCISDLRAP